jgi:D-serine deaminase-like pyridoxal phosphate-dependent protein
MTTTAELFTPALLLDLDALERNLDWMQQKANRMKVALRPHIKTHKCIEIANRQREKGAVGLTVSTFKEAELFAEAGFADITWALPLPPVYIEPVIELQKKAIVRVLLDDLKTAQALAELCRSKEVQIHAWEKVDCGLHRAGVDPESEYALQLTRFLVDSNSLIFDGILTHSGHSYNGQTRQEILSYAKAEVECMCRYAKRLRDHGMAVPGVSIGSTPAVTVVEDLEGITEIRPGNYALHDWYQASIGSSSIEDCAVSVLTSIISHQQHASHFIVDAGALALSKDQGPRHRMGYTGYGVVLRDDGRSVDSGLVVDSLTQEHGKIIIKSPERDGEDLAVGRQLRILENHSCLTVAMFDEFVVVRGNVVIDRWKIHRERT